MSQYTKEFREQAILLSDERNCRTEGSKWNPKGCNEFFRKRPEKIAYSKFEYIFQFKQKNFESQLKKDYSVKKLCKVLTVSKTGFYKWKRNRNKPKAWQILLQKIYEILDEYPDNHNYGIDRILLALNQKGEYPSRSTVIWTMKKVSTQAWSTKLNLEKCMLFKAWVM